jgi:hypothetical protein
LYLSNCVYQYNKSYSIAVAPKNVIDEHGAFLNNRRTPTTPDFGVWVKGKQGSKEGTFLAHGSEGIMKDMYQCYLRLAGCHWRQSCWWIVEFRCHGCCLGGW